MTPQQVDFKLQVAPASKPVATGQQIGVTVVDERPRDVIGYRGVGKFGATITSKQDLSLSIQSTLLNALKRLGFAPSTAAAPRQLRVEIRNLEYSLIPGVFVGTVETEAALKAICVVDKVPEYDRLYRGKSQEQVIAVQFAAKNEEHINNALSEATQSILDDGQLLTCLHGSAYTAE